MSTPFLSTPIARFEMARRIRWAETAPGGMVHFATYLKLMEETEYGFLRSRSLSVVLSDGRGTIGFPRLHVDVDVERPLVFDEQVSVRLALTRNDGKQIVYEFQIVDDDSLLVATGRFRVACCRFPPDSSPYAILIPDFVMDALAQRPLL